MSSSNPPSTKKSSFLIDNHRIESTILFDNFEETMDVMFRKRPEGASLGISKDGDRAFIQ
jgi:hypothetical protein